LRKKCRAHLRSVIFESIAPARHFWALFSTLRDYYNLAGLLLRYPRLRLPVGPSVAASVVRRHDDDDAVADNKRALR
jgi:hypothetical protein